MLKFAREIFVRIFQKLVEAPAHVVAFVDSTGDTRGACIKAVKHTKHVSQNRGSQYRGGTEAGSSRPPQVGGDDSGADGSHYGSKKAKVVVPTNRGGEAKEEVKKGVAPLEKGQEPAEGERKRGAEKEVSAESATLLMDCSRGDKRYVKEVVAKTHVERTSGDRSTVHGKESTAIVARIVTEKANGKPEAKEARRRWPRPNVEPKESILHTNVDRAAKFETSRELLVDFPTPRYQRLLSLLSEVQIEENVTLMTRSYESVLEKDEWVLTFENSK
ncbi:hypothetical protein Dimus_036192 [Dionaea muscipula]